MGDGISSSAWSRSTSKPEKPTQGAPARAGCPTPAAKSAPSGAHSAQITQVCEWRTRPIAWPSRRRNRFLNSGLRFLTLDARPPRARTLPKPQINFHSRLERRFQNAKTSPIRPDNCTPPSKNTNPFADCLFCHRLTSTCTDHVFYPRCRGVLCLGRFRQ